MLTFNAEELENCIKNIDTIADLESGHVYMICLDDTKLDNSTFMHLVERVERVLDDLHVKCIVIPTSLIDKVYKMIPVDSK